MIIIISPVVIIVVALILVLGLHMTTGALIAIAAICGFSIISSTAIVAYMVRRSHENRPVFRVAERPQFQASSPHGKSVYGPDKAAAVISMARSMGIETTPWQAQVLAAAYSTDAPIYRASVPVAELESREVRHEG